VTGFHNIPPWGLSKPIVVRYYLNDDENNIYPKPLACFSILYLPTVHSNGKSFESHFAKALEVESIGFSDAS